jgi:Inner membrane protein YgaP-like, transmembrane domain
MKKNVGSADKVFRVVLGIAVILLGIIFQSWWGLIGIIPLFTGLVNFCPLYAVLGLSTSKKAAESK